MTGAAVNVIRFVSTAAEPREESVCEEVPSFVQSHGLCVLLPRESAGLGVCTAWQVGVQAGVFRT